MSVAGSIPVAAQAVEAPWSGDMPGLHLPPSLSRTDSYTGVLMREAEEQQRIGVSADYDWKAPPASSADWRGIRRDTGYFLGYQVAAIGVIYIVPEEISGWSPEQKDNYSIEKWKENVSNPHWDDDRWWINYILHPYWGGAYYIRAQQRGLDRGQSFLYSTLLSTLFEYGVEALFEQPSYQDLILTPVVGSLVGEYLFTPLRESLRARQGELNWTGKTLLVLTDPLGALNTQMDRLLGMDTETHLQLVPVVSQAHGRQQGNQLDVDSIQGWELRMRITW